MYKCNSNIEVQEAYASEAELWNNFRSGSEVAYTYIYQNYAYLLYSYGLKITPEATVIEDCIQDLFIKLWVNKSNLGPTLSVKNYLLKAFRRSLKDAIQKNKLTKSGSKKELDFKLTLLFESERSQEQIQLEKEKKLQLAIEKLSSRQKEVIYLRFYKKMTNEEIAEVMVISVPSVYNLVSKALVVLGNHIYLLSITLILSLLVNY